MCLQIDARLQAKVQQVKDELADFMEAERKKKEFFDNLKGGGPKAAPKEAKKKDKKKPAEEIQAALKASVKEKAEKAEGASPALLARKGDAKTGSPKRGSNEPLASHHVKEIEQLIAKKLQEFSGPRSSTTKGHKQGRGDRDS